MKFSYEKKKKKKKTFLKITNPYICFYEYFKK